MHPKVAILGPGSIGKFHAREFRDAGCEVTAILSSSEATAKERAKDLLDSFRIKVRPYHNLETLLKCEELDAVSICTPANLHSSHIRECLNMGLHVLCEKPFVFDSPFDNYLIAKSLIDLAKEKEKILAVNTQWTTVLGKVLPKISTENMGSFGMLMEPSKIGLELITEGIPHTNSMLIRLLPKGIADNISFLGDEKKIRIKFDYISEGKKCAVEYAFNHKSERPRNLSFSINGVNFVRKLGERYKQFLEYSDGTIELEDPLKLSIQFFVKSLTKNNLQETYAEILENVRLQDQIVRSYLVTLKK
jgi:hypothetical protein